MTERTQITKGQCQATDALLKFCRRHGHAQGWIDRLMTCLESLQSKDAAAVKTSLVPFHDAGMGSFIDWFPDAVHQDEDNNYVETIWNALYENWREQMNPHWQLNR